ncbi:MAG: winged helix-turn-helix domain-containing protein [Dehalococcoidales bacterium]|nr:winged helix-turn-helix domain-containing protein [Dehalococcoidales bacterium]
MPGYCHCGGCRVKNTPDCRLWVQTSSPVYKNYRWNGFEVDFKTEAVYIKGKEINVSPIEWKIISLLAENSGLVVTNTVISDRVWAHEGADDHTIQVHMARLKRKLDGYIQNKRGLGYLVPRSE